MLEEKENAYERLKRILKNCTKEEVICALNEILDDYIINPKDCVLVRPYRKRSKRSKNIIRAGGSGTS